MDEVKKGRGRRGRPRPEAGERRRRTLIVAAAAVAAFALTLAGLHAFLGRSGGSDPRVPGAGTQAACVRDCDVTTPSATAPPSREAVAPPAKVSAEATVTSTPTASPGATTPGAAPRRTAAPAPTSSPGPPSRQPREPRVAPVPARAAASYATADRWRDGYIGTVTITNTGGTTLPSWSLRASFPRTTITSTWTQGSGQSAGGGETLTGSGGALAPGEHVRIVFQASGRPYGPSACSINDAPC
ncbi:cellulose binding domain-containing protein [Actinomadura flavalba]|uniref:cellulose binding domain-containing protein n=1 Tax=Actinomadura flavalba TaxID=1120938 RepID=UPI000376AEB0|nr:cellulose binding domain-containing protein [Actinomadura flavalba]